ncbi:MAG: archease [Candidatus Thorarchaeota archaeon]|nr:archease [Candidatus Thorarchaeota archaeon]
MERGFRFHEHTADITIECWAPTIKDAFEEAAKATFEVILDTTTVASLESVEVSVQGIDLEELLVEWIGTLISLIDINNQFFSRFEIIDISQKLTGFSLKGRAFGESIDFNRHIARTEVKAMTYADMKILEGTDRTTLWFTLDL